MYHTYVLLGIPHATTEKAMYAGYVLPKGTIILPNLVSLNRDEDRYNNAEVFEPRRFLGDPLDASSSALQADYMRRDHFHYGFGRRLCQGIFMAESSLFISISRILWAFDVKQLPGQTLNMSEKICTDYSLHDEDTILLTICMQMGLPPSQNHFRSLSHAETALPSPLFGESLKWRVQIFLISKMFTLKL